MLLSRFKIRDFQSYRTLQEVRLDPNLTILAGRNNVGKTALLRGMRFLAQQVEGAYSDFRVEYTAVISLSELVAAFQQREESPLLIEHLGLHDSYELRTVFESQLNRNTLPRVTQGVNTQCSFGPWYLTDARFVDSDLRFGPAITNNGSPVWWWTTPGLNTQYDEEAAALLNHCWSFISHRISYSLYIQPRRTGAQKMQFQITEELASDGSNLTTVVATLYTNHRREEFAQLQDFMCSAFPEIELIDVHFEPAPPATQAQIRLVYGLPDGLVVPLEHCGTGIEQMLMFATAIFTAKTPRLFLIDEPHAFLHPAAERHLLRLIQEHPEHQYVVATHSAVFLNNSSFAQARLVTLDGEGSHVTDVHHAAEILDAVGITPADLWAADALLWIEGPSDVAAVEEIIAQTDELRKISCWVRAMPDWIRSAAGSADKAQRMVRFCEAVVEAITPVKIPSLFVFDGDEKGESLKEQVVAETGGKAHFLPVRELENLLLSPTAIHTVLAQLCCEVGVTLPTVEEITQNLKELLADTANLKFYKHAPTGPDEAKVIGSHILETLWWNWATTQYDKTADGRKLAKEVCACEPARLEPLREMLRELAELVRRRH